MTLHGHTKGKFSPTYHSWAAMIQRCKNPKREKFAKYGHLGVDDRWTIFKNFLADMGERPAGTSLDRIDNDRGYSKDNCRWATPSQQAVNRRNTNMVTIEGVTLCAKHWAQRLSVHLSKVRSRMRHRNMTYQEVLTELYEDQR
jgi:hypothetical protein